MNILLIQAYLGGKETPVFPLGLSCLASSIKGHNLKIFDPNVSEDYIVELSDILGKYRPNLVGISLRNIDSTNKSKVVFYYGYLKETIDVIKADPGRNIKIVIGGSGFSMFANEIMQNESRIDYGVFLEGESTFTELLEHFDQPKTVRGIYYRENGKLVFTGPRNQVDLNTIAIPDRKIFPMESYFDIPDAIGVETKRGCTFGCIYCVYGFLNGKNLRLKEPLKVVDEIESLKVDMKVKNFTFVDSVFNFPLSHAESICKEIIKRGLDVSWSAWFHENYLDEEFVDLVRNAGCKKIILSPDGFSDDILSRLGKTIKKKDILRVFDMLKDVDGIETCYNFFKNPPGQNFFTFLRLMKFYFKAKISMKDKVHFEFNSIRIEPYTKLYKIALEEGIIDKDNNLLYPTYFTTKNNSYIERLFSIMLLFKGK